MEKSIAAKAREYINNKSLLDRFTTDDIASSIKCDVKLISSLIYSIRKDGYVECIKSDSNGRKKGVFYIYNRIKKIPIYNKNKKRVVVPNKDDIDFNSPWYKWCYAIN